MKNKLLTITFLSFMVIVKAQNYYLFEINICDNNHNPKQFELISIFAEQKEISWSITNEFGDVDFILTPDNNIIDSIYLLIQSNNENKSDMIYLNNINLLNENKTINNIIILRKFKYYTKQEFDEYKKKHQLLPNRVKIH